MKNLKRVLSLALAGTMLSGMMVMGAGATSFPDDEKIDHQEAVETMVALNIINGKDDGNYDPDGLVTRAEMAKMIATTMNGGIAPDFGTKPTPSYTDIKGHWAEQYIEYCTDMKIINGRGDGTFDPNGNVTGIEASKMILTALGYDATAFQLTGADWAINVAYVATTDCEPSLYDELAGTNMNVAIDRDTAAQVIWNGIQNRIVTRTPDKSLATGEVTYNYSTKGNPTLLKKEYDANITIATFTGNSNMDTTLKAGQLNVNVGKNDDPDGVSGTGAKSITADLDISYVGEIVKVIWKNEKNTSKGLDTKDKVYGVYPTGETEVIKAIKADIGDVKSSEQQIKIDGTKYTLADTVKVVTNYALKSEKTKTFTKNAGELTGVDKDATNKIDADNSALTKFLKGDSNANGDTVKFVCDNEGDIAYIYVVESDLAVVTSKNSTKVTLNNGVGTLTIADHDIYEDIAVDDVVVITTLYADDATDDKAFNIVEKAETVTGEVEGYKKTESVTVDGTVYNIENEKLFTTGIEDSIKAFNAENTYYIGEDVVLYMIHDYVGAAAQTSESASNYSVVLEVKQSSTVNSVFDALQLYVMNAEGTKTIITVSDDSDLTEADKYSKGDLITYTMNKDDEAVVTVRNASKTATEGYVKSTKSFNGLTTTGNCVLFTTVNANGTVKAYNIRDLKDVALAGTVNYVTSKDGTRVVAVYIDAAKKPSGATSSTVYGIVSADKGTVKVDGTTYSRYTVQVNGESYTVNTNVALEKGNIVSLEPTSDNIYSSADVKVITTGAVYVDEYIEKDEIISVFLGVEEVKEDNKVVSHDGTDPKTYAVDSDVKLYFVDVKNSKGVESGSVAPFDEVNGYTNAILIFGSDKKTVEAIIVETSGEKDILKKD